MRELSMSVAKYLDKYFECVESLPLELQRYVTQLREVEMEARGIMDNMKSLRCQLSQAVCDADTSSQQMAFRKLQQCLLRTRDFGNEKLDIAANLVETVEDYSQQLMLRGKAIDTSCDNEFYHPHLNPVLVSTSSAGPKDLSNTTSIINGLADTKSSNKKNTGTKRARPTPLDCEEEAPVISGPTRESSSTPSIGNSQHTNNGRSAKKKLKIVKKRSVVTTKVAMTTERDSPPPVPSAHVPMPDLTSQPLDPNEPTYCLCQQVSFGEMIGCDNDDCPIEWFHFQCVGLTSKPKGKWFCPQCSQSRKTKMSKQ